MTVQGEGLERQRGRGLHQLDDRHDPQRAARRAHHRQPRPIPVPARIHVSVLTLMVMVMVMVTEHYTTRHGGLV
jgi:hypothetical protein